MKQRWFAVIILAMMLLLAACGGTAQPETDQAETDTNTPVAAATNTTAPAPTEAVEPTEEPEEEPTEEPEEEPTEEPEEEATEEPEEEPTEEADTGDEGDDTTAEGQSLFAVVDDIDSFRMRTNVTTEGEAFADAEATGVTSFTMEGEFVREPPAQHFTISTGNEESESMLGGLSSIEIIQIEDTGYANFGMGWTEMGAGDLMSGFDDFTFMNPEDMNLDLEEMERVGEEEVNGRNTIHLRGGEEFVAAMNEDDETFAMEDLEEAQLDLWMDEDDNFIVKMQMVAEGTGINPDNAEASGRLEILVEYYDFNEDITIEAPDESALMEIPEMEVPDIGSISEALGLDLELPEGTEVGFATDGVATFTIPMSMEDAAAFIEEALAGNGFELDVDASLPEAGSYSFTAEGRTVSVLLVEEGDATNVTISVTEE